jgi:hypothetical protein
MPKVQLFLIATASAVGHVCFSATQEPKQISVSVAKLQSLPISLLEGTAYARLFFFLYSGTADIL